MSPTVRIRSMLLITLVIFSLFIAPALHSVVSAQEGVSDGVSTSVPIADRDASVGKIVSLSDGTFHLATIEYDKFLFGIITTRSAIAFTHKNAPNDIPVLTSGTTKVVVTNSNGAIKKGDAVTSSTMPGVGMKATRPGNIVGFAMENFNPPKKGQTGVIQVSSSFGYYSFGKAPSNSFVDSFLNTLETAAQNQPPIAFKYTTAGFIIVASILFALYFFGSAALRGIEALGRNPLAASIIQKGITKNILVTVVAIICGLLIALVILAL